MEQIKNQIEELKKQFTGDFFGDILLNERIYKLTVKLKNYK